MLTTNNSNGYNGKFQLGDYVIVQLDGQVKSTELDGSSETVGVNKESFSGMIVGAMPLGMIQFYEELRKAVDWDHINELAKNDPTGRWTNELMFIVILFKNSKYTIVFQDALTPAHRAN